MSMSARDPESPNFSEFAVSVRVIACPDPEDRIFLRHGNARSPVSQALLHSKVLWRDQHAIAFQA